MIRSSRSSCRNSRIRLLTRNLITHRRIIKIIIIMIKRKTKSKKRRLKKNKKKILKKKLKRKLLKKRKKKLLKRLKKF